MSTPSLVYFRENAEPLEEKSKAKHGNQQNLKFYKITAF
jgi:hypothetical protein